MKTLKQIIFLPVIYAGFMVLAVIGYLYVKVYHIFIKGDYSFKKQYTPILTTITSIPNGVANAFAGDMLNSLLLKRRKNGKYYKGVYKYGKWNDYISEVTGINKKRGLLTKNGKRFDSFLDVILGDNHSIEAINNDKKYES